MSKWSAIQAETKRKINQSILLDDDTFLSNENVSIEIENKNGKWMLIAHSIDCTSALYWVLKQHEKRKQTKGRINFWLDILIADFLHLNGYSFIISIEFSVYFLKFERNSLNDDTNAWTNFQTSFHLNASAFQARLPYLLFTILFWSVFSMTPKYPTFNIYKETLTC